MRRIVIFALAALVAATALAAVASAGSDSSTRVRGVVALKDPASRLVTLRAKRQAVALRVPGSMSAIRVGQRVELRGSTLRSRGNGSRVLARNVTVASSGPLGTPSPKPRDDDDADDDELEIKGKITSLSPLTVQSATRSATCVVPAGRSLAGFAVGDFVEMTCDLSGSAWVLRKIESEDDDDDGRGGDDDDRSGSGSGDDDDDDRSGPGGGDDDDDDDDNSGPGGGDDDDDDDDDDDNSGRDGDDD